MSFKLILFISAIILFITILLSSIGNYLYADSMESQSTAYTLELQNQVQKALETRVDAVHKSLTALGGTSAVQAYLRLDRDSEYARVELETAVRNQLMVFSRSYPEIFSVLLTGTDYSYVSNDLYRVSRKSLNLESWYDEAVRQNGAPALSSRPIGRNLSSWKRYSTDNVLSISQAVYSDETGELLGVLLADMDLQEIRDIVDGITLAKTGFMMVMDSHGQVVYGPQNALLYRVNSDWFSGRESGSIVCSILGGNYNLIYNRSAYTNLVTIGVFDMNQTMHTVSRILYTSWLVASVILLLAIVGAVIFASQFTRPVTRLAELMTEVQTGNLDVSFDNRYSGEIGYLGSCFNIMVSKMKALIELVYEEQKNKREAELKILQAQIKPHFLYNTLDTIQWMAKRHGAEDVVDIVHALTNLFRVSLSRGREKIPLSDELSHVRSYLYIQKTRYEELFDYEITCDESLLHCRVLKLILQPIVENAIYHGIKELDEYGTISIEITREDAETMLLSVSDSGVGLPPERCAELNALIKNPSRGESVKAYGILNVSDRIKLSFGEKYGITFSPRQGGGTVAELRHKIEL